MSKKLLALITSIMTLVVLCGAPVVSFAYDGGVVKKEETVYVVTDSYGSQNDVIVSEHLYNDKQIKSISDETTLKDIQNVKGNEKFTKKGDKLTWAANGKDIYYQGKTNKEVPVLLDVNYRLDGKVVSGNELQGKSGNVEITVHYTNNCKYEGKTVPFIVLTGLIITDTSFTDIKIDHGKIIDDGDKQVVVGIAAPGLAQELDIAEADLGFGDSIKITGKAKKFAVEDMMTIVTSSLFEDIDTGDFDLDYDDQIKQLNDGAKKLNNGSKDLSNGVQTLSSKLKNKLAEVIGGTETIQNGLQTMKNSITYVDTSETPTNPGLAQAVGIAKAKSGEAKTNAGTADYYIKSAVSALDGIDTTGMTDDQIMAIKVAKTAIGTADTYAANGAVAGGAAETYLGGVASGVDQISANLGDTSNPKTLIGGTNAIKAGLQQSMGEGGELSEGLAALTDGAKQVSDGMNTLYQDGIKKIVDLYNDDLKGLANGLDDVMDAGKGYKTFTKLPKDMDGSVKFIYKTTINK